MPVVQGCKRDCPVGVDMAAYKTEFLAQRYRGAAAPAAHYSMGALPRWLPVVGRLPARWWTPQRGGPWSGWGGGQAPGRDRPGAGDPAGRAGRPFAPPPTVRSGGAPPAPATAARPGPAPLWPDTFTNHFDPGSPPTPSRCWRRSGTPSSCPPHRLLRAHLDHHRPGRRARRVLRRSLRRDRAVARRRRAGRRAGAVLHRRPARRRPRAAPRRAARARRSPGSAPSPRSRRPRRRAARRRRRPGQRALVQVHCHQHADLGVEADQEGARRPGCRRGGARLRLLRAGRQLRLREGPLRGVDGLCRAGAAAGGPRGRP